MQQKNKALIVIFLTVFIDLVGFGIIIPLNPYLARDFGADPFQVGLLMSIYSTMQFVFSPFWGNISDRIGRRPVILLCLLGVGISHFMFAWSSSLTMLFVARGLGGFFGANISTAMAYISDVTDESERSKNMGIVGAAFGLGFVLGPFLGGVAGQLGVSLGSQPPLGESFPAVIAGVISILNFIFAYFVLKESLNKESIEKAKLRPSRLKLILKYIKPDTLGFLFITTFIVVFGMAHMEASMFMYVSDKFGWSLIQASFGFAYIGIIIAFTQGFLIRKLLPIMGERKMLVSGFIMSAAGLFLIGVSSEIILLAISVTLLGFGNGFINPSLMGSISLLSDKSEQGMVMGVNQSLSALGRILGPALGGYIYMEISWSSPFYVASFMYVFGLVIIFLLYSQLPNKGIKA